MQSLQRIKILITRPKHQAKKLASDIALNEGIPIFFPTIEIVPTANKILTSKIFNKIDYYDFVIFISPNAVLQAACYIGHLGRSWPKKTKLIAIGQGTADTLETRGLIVDYRPEKNFNSEGILTLPPLQNLKQKKILICQGEDARSTLTSELKQRGANVDALNLYKRECPLILEKNIPKQNAVDVIICTSQTGLKNLIYLLEPSWKNTLFNKQLLVISPRIAELVKKLGFVKTPLISDNATNEAILHTLKIYTSRKLDGKN